MDAPQIIYLMLNALAIGLHLSKLGRPREGVNDLWPIWAWVFITLPLLYWGGFFG